MGKPVVRAHYIVGVDDNNYYYDIYHKEDAKQRARDELKIRRPNCQGRCGIVSLIKQIISTEVIDYT